MNLLTIFAVVLLYIRTGSNTDSLRQQEAVMKQTEDMLQAFLLEMKEENDAVIESLGSVRRQPEEAGIGQGADASEEAEASGPSPVRETSDPEIGQAGGLAVHERDILELSPEALKKAGENRSAEKPAKQSFTDALSRELNKPEKPLAEEVSGLAAAGLSPEEIARRLNKGKTEIELLLKFRR